MSQHLVPSRSLITPLGEPSLVDRFGRTATSLRVSLTDRCNLRCTYCMPPEGLEWLPNEHTLTSQEVLRLCQIAVEKLGITHIRFTGGEPLLRGDLESIIMGCGALKTKDGNKPELSITTNGLGLIHRAQALKDAGLDRINISLDSVNPEHYAAITKRDRLKDVLAGIAKASEVGLCPIKINTVLMRGVNDGDISELLDFCIAGQLQLRFIEQMPIGPQGSWKQGNFVSMAEILLLLSQHHLLTPIGRNDPHAPATLFMVDNRPDISIGVIASVSSPFCNACDRTRLTSDGHVRSCLFSQTETNLRAALRNGQDDRTIAHLWQQAMWFKPERHGKDGNDFAVPSRTMSRIGG